VLEVLIEGKKCDHTFWHGIVNCKDYRYQWGTGSEFKGKY
jgi:hypothetical protein